MSPRRARGALEADVLRSLWAAERPITAAEMRAELDAAGTPLAHTTVLTVLARLVDKGQVARDADGRHYRATRSEAAATADTMASALAAVADRAAALRRFTGTLSDEDVDVLRRALDRG
jgi:predicted transcriptional regulator